MTERFLDRRAQAEYLTQKRGLKTTKAMLDKLASQGGGPEYWIWGNRAVSTEKKLDEWADERLGTPRCSTSEAVEAAA